MYEKNTFFTESDCQAYKWSFSSDQKYIEILKGRIFIMRTDKEVEEYMLELDKSFVKDKSLGISIFVFLMVLASAENASLFPLYIDEVYYAFLLGLVVYCVFHTLFLLINWRIESKLRKKYELEKESEEDCGC